ncbi:hypothetical protein [Streptomyces ziwulingensis]|uniref:hypothetical protein n=1 Tax=Streptomyces ziwulingensis TaxID=1045501 RepID=UPI0031EC6CEB
MDRRTPAPTPTAHACTTCARLTAAKQRAHDERDHSRETDCRVLLARHRAEAHGGTR